MNTADKYLNTETFDTDAPLRIDSLRIDWIHDDNPDLSFLRQDYADCDPTEAAKYQDQDKEQLEAYNRGDWQMMGCQAVAIVSRPIGAGSRRLQRFTSGGLWGIESDANNAFRAEVEAEELDDLKEHLAAFGIPWPDDITVEGSTDA